MVLGNGRALAEALGEGPFSEMNMLLERTIFRVDVLKVKLHFGVDTQKELRNLAQGQKPSEELANKIVDTIYKTPRTTVRVQFLWEISYEQYMDEVRKSLQCSLKSGVLNQTQHNDVVNRLDQWYGRLRERGLKEGDQLVYTLEKDTIQTTFLPKDKDPVINPVVKDARVYILSILSGYLASCSEFRKPLIKSLEAVPQS